ncbi:protein of unknown function [Tenacibaculum aestuariivivum]
MKNGLKSEKNRAYLNFRSKKYNRKIRNNTTFTSYFYLV